MYVFISKYLYRPLYVLHNCKTNFLRDNKDYYYYNALQRTKCGYNLSHQLALYTNINYMRTNLFNQSNSICLHLQQLFHLFN